MLEKSDDNLDDLMFKLGLPKFKQEDLHYFRDYCVIFKPFTMALNILQGEQNACIGYLLPVLSKLKTNVSLAGEESLTCKPLAKALIEGIDKRFSDDFKNPDCVLAAVLSPMSKFDWIREEKDKNGALKHLERELKSIISIDKTEEKLEDNLNKQSTDFEIFFSFKKNKSSSTDQIIDLYKSDFIKAV